MWRRRFKRDAFASISVVIPFILSVHIQGYPNKFMVVGDSNARVINEKYALAGRNVVETSKFLNNMVSFILSFHIQGYLNEFMVVGDSTDRKAQAWIIGS
uniref:Uncharacterized protein n=1 Tax=Cacopsylla melanoneura TaxID=428564 RepID=A0A8D8LA65_9HEMI